MVRSLPTLRPEANISRQETNIFCCNAFQIKPVSSALYTFANAYSLSFQNLSKSALKAFAVALSVESFYQ